MHLQRDTRLFYRLNDQSMHPAHAAQSLGQILAADKVVSQPAQKQYMFTSNTYQQRRPLVAGHKPTLLSSILTVSSVI
jgi:hypothetical protein